MAPRNTYRTADGRWVALTAGTDEMVERMFVLLGRPELASDPRFRTNRARVDNVAALDELIGAWIGARNAADVVDAFQASGVSLAAIDGLAQVLSNPHFRARGDLVEVEDEEIGRLVTAAPSPRRGAGRDAIRWLGRPLGSDNRAVYRDWLGLSEAELASLEEEGVL
jgi:crotonobetainyl-CoA:carnitine CoA-transferase CaiB-like acyl-CoA transferase